MPRDMSIAIMTNAFQSKDPADRRIAAESCAKLLGEQAAQMAILLLKAVDDDDEQVREYVTSALESMGVPDSSQQAAIGELCRHENADVAYWAITLLGRLADDATAAIEEVVAALDDSRPANVQQRAAWALGRIGSNTPSAIAALEAAAQSPDARLARLAERSLSAIRG